VLAEKYPANLIRSKVKQQQGGPSNAAGRLHRNRTQDRFQIDGSIKAFGLLQTEPGLWFIVFFRFAAVFMTTGQLQKLQFLDRSP